MANVPTVDNFRTTTPAGRLPLVPEPDSAPFLAGARVIKEAAANAGAVANAAQQHYVQQLDEANRVRVTEASNRARREAMRLTYDPEEGYAHIKGGDVMDRPSGQPLQVEYDEKLDGEIKSIAGELSNRAQREMFAVQSDAIRTQFMGEVEQHSATEYRGWKMSTYAGAVKLENENIAAHPNDVALIDQSLKNIDANVAAIGLMNGKSANEIESDQNLMRSKAIGDAILTAMDREDGMTTANSLFKIYENQLDANTMHAIRGPLEEGLRAEQTLSVLDTIDGRSATVNGTVVPTVGATPLYTERPVAGGIKKGDFGDPRPGHIHNGEDWAVPVGTPVFAQMQGEVIRAWTDDANGHAMKVKYADGSIHGFAHLSQALLPVGATVTPGQVFAKTGDTGRSTGPHLHWTVEVNGSKIDPSDWATAPGSPGSVPQGTRTVAGNVETYVNAAIDELKRRDPNASPQDIAAVRQEATSRWSIHSSGEREAAADATDAAIRHINGGGTTANMPASIKRAVNQYNPAGWGQVVSYEQNLRNPAASRDPKQDDILYNNAITKPADLKAMTEAEFLSVYAGHPQFNTIANHRAGLLGLTGEGNATSGDLDFGTINTIVDDRMTSLGIKYKDAEGDVAAQVGAIRGSINQLVLAEQRRTGKALDDSQLQNVIDGFFTRQQAMDPGWFGDPYSQAVATLTYDEIPDSDIAKIEARLKAGGKPVTEQAVLQMYMMMPR